MTPIGNINCKNNAMHNALRCAINPYGPCDGCPDFTQISVRNRISRRIQILNPKAYLGFAVKSACAVGLGIAIGLVLIHISPADPSVRCEQK
jgi:Family of unknown function (DUF6464)